MTKFDTSSYRLAEIYLSSIKNEVYVWTLVFVTHKYDHANITFKISIENELYKHIEESDFEQVEEYLKDKGNYKGTQVVSGIEMEIREYSRVNLFLCRPSNYRDETMYTYYSWNPKTKQNDIMTANTDSEWLIESFDTIRAAIDHAKLVVSQNLIRYSAQQQTMFINKAALNIR